MARPHKLEYYGTSTITATDISESIETIDKFTDVGTGEIVSAKLMIDARFGDFVTEANSGQTPIIQQYDLFKLTVTDDDDNSYTRYLIQDDIAPQKNSNGSHLVLELFGRERYLQKMYFIGHFYFISFKDMIIKIRDFYNTNKGSSQPGIRVASGDVATIPEDTYGVFEFGEKTTVYDALMEVVKRLSLPVAAGGAGEYYGLTFSDVANGMLMRISPVGSFPANPLVLEKPLTLSEVKSPIEGNIAVVKGQKGTGSYPKGPALWRSLAEEFENLPLWISAVTYKKGRYVRYNDAIYQAKNKHTTANILPTVTASWNVVTFADYVAAFTGVNDFQYSDWTKEKQGLWRNWGGNAGANNGNSFLANNVPAGKDVYDSLCFTDHNLVIRDKNAWRDWADFRVASLSDIPAAYLYAATTDANTVQKRLYFGIRVLIDPAKGTIGAPFTDNNGKDKFGKSFENSLAMLDRDGDWIVFRNARQFDECAVVSEKARIYEYNTPPGLGGMTGSRITRSTSESNTNLAWRDMSKVLAGNDCFHYPSKVENTDGLIGEVDNSIITLDNGTNSKFTDNSAIKIEYEYGETEDLDSPLQVLNPLILGLLSYFNEDGSMKEFPTGEDKMYEVEAYNIGWWATLFEAPYPKSTYNGISESVGELFGGDADNKLSVLDLQNLNQTPSGKTGYGHADSDLLGPLDGFKLLFNYNISGLDLNTFKGDLPFRATIYDLLGNVWISDIALRFQELTQEFNFPFSSFKIYRARIQPGFSPSSVISRTINPELKITEIFEKRLIKKITLQSMLSHDDDGRYDPWTWEGFIRGITTGFTGTYITYSGIIDAFHFTKTPVAIARDTVNATNSVSQRHLNTTIKEYPGISNMIQLQKIANSELNIAKHKKDAWTAKYSNRADICADDAVYLKNTDFISETDKTGEINTRRLIVKKVTYSIGDRSSTSGFIATVEVYRQVAT